MNTGFPPQENTTSVLEILLSETVLLLPSRGKNHIFMTNDKTNTHTHAHTHTHTHTHTHIHTHTHTHTLHPLGRQRARKGGRKGRKEKMEKMSEGSNWKYFESWKRFEGSCV